MNRDGRYWRWARRVVARGGGVGSALEAGAVLRVLGTPDALAARLEALADTGNAATTFETPPPFEREGLEVGGSLDALRTRLERSRGRVQIAWDWLKDNGFRYKPEEDALRWRKNPSREGRLVVTIAACQAWRLYYEQEREGCSYAQGAPLPHGGDAPVADIDPALLSRIRRVLALRFPADLLSRDTIRNAIQNHGRDTSVPNLRDLPRLP